MVVIALAVVMYPLIFDHEGSDGTDDSWRSVATATTDEEQVMAGDECSIYPEVSPLPMRLELSERRGDWVLLIYANDSASAYCLAFLPEGSAEAIVAGSDYAVKAMRPPLAGGFASVGTHLLDPAGIGTPQLGHWSVIVHGEVGENVESMSIGSPTGETVEVSINDGRYAAWWPERTAHEREGPTELQITYRLVLIDGSEVTYAELTGT